VLLDTNVVIAFFADDKTIRERVTQTRFVLSSTVLGELYYGARKSDRAASNLSRIDEFAASLAVLACDAVTAQSTVRSRTA
jgi:tRNA(fMet)-specific endonuclease VapC